MSERVDSSLVRWLQQQGALHDVTSWVAHHAPTWERFWQECPRGDWLLGVAVRAGAERGVILDATIACLDVLDPYLPREEPVIERALFVLRAHRTAETDAAARAELVTDVESLLTRCDDPSAHAAVLALTTCLSALDDATAAPAFVAMIVQAATLDAGDCAMLQAARFTEHACAERIRATINLGAIAVARDATGGQGVA